ncbi:hypothetical protein PVK06_027700 [Gossypium arboreum]|uniref:Aminotransferase-like plant mobile domain-containing protein n=1 Tax=Gossypium arboreum TaxID=29729 RepID=A0ABR0P130_GOSAR|nr:hypothetical protein PVK06_027700 [Gossypium arboreum]
MSTLVKRWHSETYTFYLLCGECNITLQDVELQLRLRVEDVAITSSRIGKSETLILYRQMIEAYPGEEFVWMSYVASHVAGVIPQSAYHHSYIWCIIALVLNFSTIKWCNKDRILRKFRCKQDVLDVLINFNNVNDINKRGNMQRIGDWVINSGS